MPTHRTDDGAIREHAYLLWEQDGKPEGRATEYWMRAKVALSDKEEMATLTAAPPDKARAKEKVKEKVEKAAKKKK